MYNQLRYYQNGFIDGKLVYLSLRCKKLGYFLLDREERLAFKERMNKLMIDINKNSPKGVNKAFMSGGDNWPWLMFRSNLLSDCISGACVTLLFAFVILLLTTLNSIVSLLSILCIAAIIIQMISMIYLMDWKFGLIESICVIVFIGISVDYVSHFSHMF